MSDKGRRGFALAGLGAGVGRDLLDLVMPRDCSVCARPGRALCALCSERLHDEMPVAATPIEVSGQTVPVVCGGWLVGDRDITIRAWKDDAIRGLVHPLARLLAAGIAEVVDDTRTYALTGIPASRRAHWERGEDIVHRLTTAAGKELRKTGWPVTTHRLLRVVRQVSDQRTLSASQRHLNLAGAFAARQRVCQPVIVIDDVVTTGSTVRESVRALTAAGMAVHAVVALAHASGFHDTTR